MRAQEAAEERHEEGRADALVAHVADDEGHAAVVEGEGVVEIARDLARRVERGADLPARGGCGSASGRKLPLDLAPDLELALEARRAVARGVFEALLLERRRHAGAQDDGVERLRKVVGRAELDGRATASISSTAEIMMTGIVRSTASARMRSSTSKPSISGIMMSSRTRSIGRAASDLERGAPVHRGLDLVAERAQAAGEQVPVDLDVVDDEEAAGAGRRGARTRLRGRRGREPEELAEIRDLLLGRALAFLDDVGDACPCRRDESCAGTAE